MPLKVDATERGKTGGAVRKSGLVRSLGLQSGETAAARDVIGKAANPALLELAQAFEGGPIASALPSAAKFAAIPDTDLVAFSQAIAKNRQKAAAAPARTANGAVDTHAQALALNAANTALVAAASYSDGVEAAVSPIGMLNLERIEMTPAGIERGGLLATIPLAPKERTTVLQQEWSVVTKEFTSVVTDSLDNYSETGVTDATQLSQSTTSQVAHSNQFNINSSVSGSYGFVTASVATAFGGQDQSSGSANASRQHAQTTTKKASSRSIESHKTTISTSTTAGSSTANTRHLENPSATDPMRIDYFSIMRKWHCALYRYGLRLTYDITIPEPGAAMREQYMLLDQLQKSLGKPFLFEIAHANITPTTYLAYADLYSVDVPPPPSPSVYTTPIGPVPFFDTDAVSKNTPPYQFTVQDGYWVQAIRCVGDIGDSAGESDPLQVIGTTIGLITRTFRGDLCANNSYLWHQSGALAMTILYHTSASKHTGYLYFTVESVPTDTAMATWRSTVWTALYNAAQAAYYQQQQQLASQITDIQTRLNNVDTLTLRREENDEIMKCALRWLLGDSFDFMPPNVIALFQANASYGIDFTGNAADVNSQGWTIVKQNEDRINFINQAIDWDNVIYFVYSYFWDVPQSWDFIRQLQHPDATRQAFLRAGSARVVLTVRQGWEVAWTNFVEYYQTSLDLGLPPHPYLTIAQQIQDYDAINYPGIPPADPDGGGPIDDGTPQVGTTCDADLAPSTSPVTIEVADSTGFAVGATAIIDSWGDGTSPTLQEVQTIVAVPDATHITVQALTNKHSPTTNQNKPYPIVQAGASGLLIAEWFEYTPTSGTDIAVTSNLATIT
ncbi:MAG TPA: hypothetical protein VGM88_16620 [Kofleriaceae bacterium]